LNTRIFGTLIWKTDRLLAAYKKYVPEIYEVLEKIKPYIGTKKQSWAIETYYPEMPSVNIEPSLIAKLPNLKVVVAPLTWTDIGSWHAIKEVLTSKAADNIIKGRHIGQSN
jgi:mannose-1-phosphate guanylyltransferase